MTGYLHSRYAESLADLGTPRELRRCGGWILVRQIPWCDFRDAMGCYPLFACQDWSQLNADLEGLVGELVSIALVTDPFGEYDVTFLRVCFPDVVMPFKPHFVVDLSCSMDIFVHPHHRRYARKALHELCVEKCANPTQLLDDWAALYKLLIERHNINGIAGFSRESFAKQLAVPGLVAFRAVYDDKTVGMLLWYIQGHVAYYHLGSYNPQGYELRASFALFWFAIEYFGANGLQWLNLGAGAGMGGEGSDGLTRFKRGWSTGTRTAYFCGRVLDHGKYSELVQKTGVSATNYFPDYRAGEFR